jgi:multidrug efflux pump subunit AcrB
MVAMTTVYLLSFTLVPCFSAHLLKAHDPHHDEPKDAFGQAFARIEKFIDSGIAVYVRALNVVLRHKVKTVVIGFGLLVVTLTVFLPIMRRDFFPEVDSGAFEIAVRLPSGTRIDLTEEAIAKVEQFIRQSIDKEDLELIVSELGLTADWSAAYTANAGPMDAIVKVQLSEHRQRTSQEYIRLLRDGFTKDSRFTGLEFSFDSGGLIRGALNEGKSSPINIQITGKVKTKKKDKERRDQANEEDGSLKLFALADKIKNAVRRIDGVVDARVLQRPDAPELTIKVDRAKAAQLGLHQDDVMKNIIAATNSSITYNKKNFWIDPQSTNQYYVGVQFPEQKFKNVDDILNIPITSSKQGEPITLKAIATIAQGKIPTEIHHVDLQPTIDLTMNVEGRDLGHVSNDVAALLSDFGVDTGNGTWAPYDPDAKKKVVLPGCKIILGGEYTKMQDTFKNLGIGLILASLLIYFLMVALDKSFLVPLTVMLIVPLCLVGILPMLYITGSAVNVQSLLGFIFIVGIKVANTVLMTDYAQELRRHEGLSPTDAIRMAASLRVRPVTMTALAAFFAMIPTALALEHGSEANAPLARAILGGLLAGEPATLFVLPALYALIVRDDKTTKEGGETENGPTATPPPDNHFYTKEHPDHPAM